MINPFIKTAKEDIFLPLFIVQVPQKTMERRGLSMQDWEQGIQQLTNISLEETSILDTFISLEQYRQVLLVATTLFGEDTLIQAWGQDIQPMHLGPIGQAVTSASTLEKSMNVLVKYLDVVMPVMSISEKSNAKEHIIKCSTIYPMPEIDTIMTELIVFSLARSLLHLGIPAEDIRINFEHNQSRSDKFYTDFLAIVPAFSQSGNTIKFPVKHLSKTNHDACSMLFKQAVRDCEKLGEKMKSLSTVTQQAYHILLNGCRKNIHYNLDEVAKKLNMSHRTISRRLKEEDTTFRELQSDVRLTLAKEQLETSTQPIKAICMNAGFQNVSAFSRAFKSKVNLSPSEYRDKYKSSN
jgi:AraC-like DNA-binding protein